MEKKSKIFKRTPKFIEPVGSIANKNANGLTYYNGQDTIVFDIGNEGYVDLDRINLEFSINPIWGAADPLRGQKFQTDAGSVIERLMVEIAGVVVMDVQSYNWHNALFKGTKYNRNNRVTQGNLLEGFYDIVSHMTPWDGVQPIVTNTTEPNLINSLYQVPNPLQMSKITYIHRLNLGFLNIKEFFPTHLVKGMKIIITLTNAENCIFFYPLDGAPYVAQPQPLHYLSNFRLYYDVLVLDPEIDLDIRQKIANNQLLIPYVGMKMHRQSMPTVPTGVVSPKLTYELSDGVGSLRTLTGMVINAALEDFNQTGSACEVFGPYTLFRPTAFIDMFQISLDGQKLFPQPLTNPLEYRYHFYNSLDIVGRDKWLALGRVLAGFDPTNHYSDGSGFNPGITKQIVRRFAGFGYNFRKDFRPESMSGLNLKGSRTKMTIEFNVGDEGRTTTYATPNQAVLFLTTYDCLLQILPNGSVNILS